MEHTGNSLGIRLRWLGCACFELEMGGVHIVNDPWITPNQKTELTWEAVEKCDYITVTHGHYDHILDIPALVKKFGAYVLCPEQTATPLMKWADLSPMNVYPMAPGLELDMDGVKIKALFGRHGVLPGTVNERIESFKTHYVVGGDALLQELFFWGDVEYRNFLFTGENGTKVLIWGNTLTRPEQRNAIRQVKPDVLLMQATNVHTPALTAQLCAELGCKVVIPHHVDFPKEYGHITDALEKALAEQAPNTSMILPEYGKWIEL